MIEGNADGIAEVDGEGTAVGPRVGVGALRGINVFESIEEGLTE